MRYRKLDANGDYSFGQGQANFWVNTPEGVGQRVKTRLGLFTGEWFLDTTEGTPWQTSVLGKYTQSAYDKVIQDRITSTPDVLSLDAYSSTLDPNKRALTVSATITTAYGTTTIEQVI